MRDSVGTIKIEDLSYRITSAFFYCIKDGGYCNISITENVCPYCKSLENHDIRSLKEYQDNSLLIGIEILETIEKTKNKDDEELFVKAKNIIHNVLYTSFSKRKKDSNFRHEDFYNYVKDNYKHLCGTPEEIFSGEKVKEILDHYLGQYELDGKQRKIQKIEVRGLFGYHNYDLNMAEENLSIIIGTNGLGKTTIFNMLESLFESQGNKEKYAVFFNTPFKEFNVEFYNGGYIRLKKESETKIKTFSKREGGFTGDMETLIEINKDDQEKNKEFYNRIHGEIFCKLFNNEKRFHHVKIKRVNYRIIHELLNRKYPPQKDSPKIKFNDFSKWFNSLYYSGDPSRKECIYEEETLKFIIPEIKEKIDSRNLSSGEMNVIAVLFEIWFMTIQGAIVLIDEPEISLHIAWQQRLGEIISEMSKKRPGIQVIVATHSPFIAASNPESIVEAELVK